MPCRRGRVSHRAVPGRLGPARSRVSVLRGGRVLVSGGRRGQVVEPEHGVLQGRVVQRLPGRHGKVAGCRVEASLVHRRRPGGAALGDLVDSAADLLLDLGDLVGVLALGLLVDLRRGRLDVAVDLLAVLGGVVARLLTRLLRRLRGGVLQLLGLGLEVELLGLLLQLVHERHRHSVPPAPCRLSSGRVLDCCEDDPSPRPTVGPPPAFRHCCRVPARTAYVLGRARIGPMKATLHTNRGDIVIDLFEHQAPKTVENFVGLAKGEKEYKDDAGRTNPTPFYDGLIFHRIIPNFMIQGGCPIGQGFGGPGYAFDDEISPDNDFTKPYILAMANAGKRMGKGTNGSQFFITTAPTTWLQGKHTIFGEVADQASRDVVDKIGAVPTGANDKPVEDVVISSVTIED